MSRAPFPTLRRRAPKEPSDEHAHHDGRQHRRRACRLSGERSVRDLPDHALFADGRRRRRMGVRRGSEHLGQCAGRPGNAGRRRRSRRAPRRLAVRRADHDVHRVARPDADAAKHVQDRRRVERDRLSCRLAFVGDVGAVDLRRPCGCDDRSAHRICAAVFRVGAGGARLRADRADGDVGVARAIPAFLRRLPHLARVEHAGFAQRRRHPLDDRRRSGARSPGARAEPRASLHPRHGAEPGHVLPGARGGQSVPRARPRDHRNRHAAVRRADRQTVSTVRV